MYSFFSSRRVAHWQSFPVGAGFDCRFTWKKESPETSKIFKTTFGFFIMWTVSSKPWHFQPTLLKIIRVLFWWRKLRIFKQHDLWMPPVTWESDVFFPPDSLTSVNSLHVLALHLWKWNQWALSFFSGKSLSRRKCYVNLHGHSDLNFCYKTTCNHFQYL